MIKINNQRINEIAHEYLNKIEITGDQEFCELLNNNKSQIILAQPAQLIDINEKFCNYDAPMFNTFKKFMNDLYQKNIGKHGHWLTKSLGINVCPYCNLNFTHTITKKSKKIRPEIDHFYPKSKFPLLALSFYNLIPSCPVCNHTKRVEILRINPYSKDFSENPFNIEQPMNAIFYGSKSEKADWKIQFANETDPYKSNIEVFGLKERYNQIKDYAEEIIFKAITYNDGYYESILQTFDQMSLTKSEMDRIIFGNYVSPDDFHKRPLSKLTHDILEQFDVKF